MSSLDDSLLFSLAAKFDSPAEPESPPNTQPDPAQPESPSAPIPCSAPRDEAALIRIARAIHHIDAPLEKACAILKNAGTEDISKQLKICRAEILDALQDAGLIIDDPLNKPFSQVVEQVDVIGWRQSAAVDSERVAQVVEPVIHRDGTLLRQGHVIMVQPLPSPTENVPANGNTPPGVNDETTAAPTPSNP
jgi:hypothetical protein